MQKIIRQLALLIFPLFFSSNIWAQCDVEISALIDSNVCGDCLTLTAFGQGQGQQVFEENFNSGNPSGWAFTQQATFTNPCSPNGVDNTPHIWMGDQSGVPRSLETLGYDLTPASAGVTICFDMLFAKQGANAPCEGPDEPDEGVAIQYSIDNGATWVNIHYFDPNGGNDPSLTNWTNWCFPVPAAAITNNTKFRWFQDNDSGAEFDHWGIDNVNIYYNDPTYNITWQHDNYSYGVGNSGGDNPNLICPKSTTTYHVEMTNGNSTCRDSVTVTVINPKLEVSAGNDTTVCVGECAQLNGTAKVIKRPAKTPTYANTQTQPITTGIGGNTEVNINIVDLNMTNILPGSITEVCIDNLTFFGFNLFPPGEQTIGDLEVRIFCPDGSSILLIPSGVTTSSTPLEGYTNTCFTPVSTSNIGTASPPYTGDFIPGQSLDDLAGCTSNGLWTMQITSTSALSFGSGAFTGWSISFDDPEISYEADYSWTPTAGLNNPNTQSPIACPTSDQEYVLTASDTAGCITLSDTVFVEIDSICCNLDLTAAVINPSCGSSDGNITLNITQGSGNYSIIWSNQATTNAINNLAAGVYSVSVEDLNAAGCSIDTSFTLNNPGGATIDSIIVTDETCLGAEDGTLTAIVSGGAQPYSFSWSNNSSNSTATGLAAGSYSLTVTDNNNCDATATASVSPGPNCCNITLELNSTNPDCGQNNGSITAIVQNGTGNYNYLWTPTGQGNSLNNLGAGTYQLRVEDIGQVNCFIDTSITLNGVVNTGITIDTAICEGEQLLYNGTVFDSVGTYTLTVSSGGQGCDTIVTLNLSYIPALGSVPEADYFNTASNGAGGTLAGGSSDLNWEVATGNIAGPYTPATVMSPTPSVYYNSPWPNADWIAHNQNGSHSGDVNFFYKIDFELPCQDSCGKSYADSNTFCIGLDFFADNSVYEIYLNGVPQSSQIPSIPAATPYSHTGYSQSGALSVSFCNGWNPGVNTLILEVRSGSPYAGFLAQASVSIPPYIAPYDTILTYICQYDTLTVDGIDIFDTGLYPFEFKTAEGCDSNVVLNVFVNESTSMSLSDTLCFGTSYEFNGNTYTQAGTYRDTLQNAVGCDSLITLVLTYKSPIVTFLDESFCPGGEFEFNGNTYTNGGTYADTLVGLSGCDSIVVLDLSMSSPIEINAGNDTLIIIPNAAQLQGSVNNNANPSGQYFWSPSYLLSCENCLNPVANPTEDQEFIFSYTDLNDCTNSDTVLVEVSSVEYAIPNAFMPSGAGGVNSQFDIIRQSGVTVKQFQIFNRWGELVHNSTSAWDGKHKGKEQPVGTYVYYIVLVLDTGVEVEETGEISLIR